MEIGNGSFQFLIFFQQLFPFQTSQAGQAHIQNGLGLLVGELEALHQGLLGGGGVRAVADDVHDLVDIVQSFEQALQNVGAGQGLIQIVFGAAGDHVLLVQDVIIQRVPQGQHLGLPVHQGQHDHAEGFLHLGMLVQVIQHHLGLHVAL